MQQAVDTLLAKHASIQTAQAAELQQSRSETAALQAEVTQLQQNLSDLKFQLTTEQSVRAAVEAQHADAVEQTQSLRAMLQSTQAEYETSQARATEFVSQLNAQLAQTEERANSEAKARALVEAELLAQAESLEAMMNLSKVDISICCMRFDEQLVSVCQTVFM